MLMEQEVPILLKIGFMLVMVPVAALVVGLMVKFKKHGYGWILGHLVLFSAGALTWVSLLETRAFASSAYNSLMIAAIGIAWAISMICFVLGLLALSSRNADGPDEADSRVTGDRGR